MKKMMKTIAAVICCAVISTVFTACTKSDDNPVGGKTIKYNYKLTVKSATDADDQQDIVKTIATTPNYDGKMADEEFSEFVEDLTIKPVLPFTTVPGSNTITINETIRTDADLTQKTEYNLGLYIKLEVTSTDENDGVIDYKEYENDTKVLIKTENLNNVYPQATTLKFDVDKNGKITITKI